MDHDPGPSAPWHATVTLRLTGMRAPPMLVGSETTVPATPVATGKRKSRTTASWRCSRCLQVDMEMFMVGCDHCNRWFHGACCGISEERAAAASTWICLACEDSEDATVRMVVNRLIARVEREELKASKFTARHDARIDGEVRRAVGRLISIIERTDASQSRPPAVRASLRAQASLKAAASSAVGSPCWEGPTVVRPAADGSYQYARYPAPTTLATSVNKLGEVAPPLFALLTPDCLEAILAMLPLPALLLSAVPTCQRFAALAEPLFAMHAGTLGLRPARRARGAGAAMQHPWRQLLRTNVCAACLAPSPNFPVRRPTSDRYGAIVCKLCMACARTTEARRRARARGLEIDSIGMDGKALFTPGHPVGRQGATAKR